MLWYPSNLLRHRQLYVKPSSIQRSSNATCLVLFNHTFYTPFLASNSEQGDDSSWFDPIPYVSTLWVAEAYLYPAELTISFTVFLYFNGRSLWFFPARNYLVLLSCAWYLWCNEYYLEALQDYDCEFFISSIPFIPSLISSSANQQWPLRATSQSLNLNFCVSSSRSHLESARQLTSFYYCFLEASFQFIS